MVTAPPPLCAPFHSTLISLLLRADYSCGCMDYGFKREKELWEASDGAVYLLAGLAEVRPQEVPAFMPSLSEVALLDHWPQARTLQTTVWTQLPRIMHGLGKQVGFRSPSRAVGWHRVHT